MKFKAFLVLCIFVIIGCGDQSKDSDNLNSVLLLGEGYNEKPGDRFIVSYTSNATYSNGYSAEFNTDYESIYSQVTEIPSKYNYSNSDPGPYLLETEYDDGELNELNYETLSGDFIINDDLDYFTSVDHTIQNGSDEPENIYLGASYSFYEDSTLFDSNSGIEIGYEIINGEISVLSEEQVSVPAGDFKAVKIGYSVSSTISKEGVTDTRTATGHGWFDTTNGFMLKMVLEMNMTLNEHGLTASGESEAVLREYSLSTSKSVNKLTTKNFSNYRINKNSIIISIKKNVLNFEQRI